jgi:hypothetical protein
MVVSTSGIEFRPALERISQTTTVPVNVWRRFAVLGPGLEFVILGNASFELRIRMDGQLRGLRGPS